VAAVSGTPLLASDYDIQIKDSIRLELNLSLSGEIWIRANHSDDHHPPHWDLLSPAYLRHAISISFGFLSLASVLIST